MEESDIVIVGNGFDVGHGLPSRYSNFKEWLRKKDISLYNFLDEYIDASGEWWNDFECNLSEFNVPKLISETPRDNHPRDPRFLPDFSHPASWRLETFRDKLSERFAEWIKSLEGMPAKKDVILPKAILYISFNYTDTLERIYGIKEDSILYIHGKASRGDELIYGHCKNQYQLEKDIQQKYDLYESDDFFKPGSFDENEYELAMGISYMEKEPYNQLVKYSERLKLAVMCSKTVYVYGFSFSEVDFPYIEWIVMKNPNLHWKVSWHNQKDKNRINKTFEALNERKLELFYM